MNINLKYLLCMSLISLFTACLGDNTQGPSEPQIRFIDTVTAQYQLPDSINVVHDTMIDARDNRVYKIVTLGGQTWMAENMVHYDAFYLFDRDTNNIHLGSYFLWNITMDYESEPEIDPYLRRASLTGEYTQGVCPENYHVPSLAEWETLFQTISDWFNLDASAENSWDGVAKILKDTNYTYLLEKDRGVDLVGFKVLETGYLDGYGGSLDYPQSRFWTSESAGEDAINVMFWTYHKDGYDPEIHNYNTIKSKASDKGFLFNVRCLKD